MTDNTAAGSLMDEAKRLVCNERTAQHGDTAASFTTVAEFWTTYLRAKNRGTDPLKVDKGDVVQMLSLLKKARHLFGNGVNEENFVDDIGYTAIAGMFSGVKTQMRAEPRTPVSQMAMVNRPEPMQGTPMFTEHKVGKPYSQTRAQIEALNAVEEVVDETIR